MAGGLYLLLTGEYGRLIRLIVASAGGTIVTFRTVYDHLAGYRFQFPGEGGGGAFYGMSHFQMLKTASVAAAFVQRDWMQCFRTPISRVWTGRNFRQGIGPVPGTCAESGVSDGGHILPVLILPDLPH